MEKIKLGIIAPADIAKRRFIPALVGCDGFELAGIAARFGSEDKAKKVLSELNIDAKVYEGYESLLNDETVNAVYIPLPPSMHFEWGKKALLAGKHVLMEKPFCTSLNQTKELVSIAREKGLAVCENYGFVFHDQLKVIDDVIDSGDVGSLRLVRASFGFPYRGENDFRYEKNLGGGALLDAGGYCIKLARHFLNEDAKIVYSTLNYIEKHNCDIFGTVILEDSTGLTAQLSFGMDNQYKCEVELWGTNGSVMAPRVFTAPNNFEPDVIVTCGMDKRIIKAKSTDQFAECIKYFERLVRNNEDRNKAFQSILLGSSDIEKVFEKAER